VPAEDRQRIDRWLWHARLVRTRGAAAALADAGYVRVNGTRIAAPSRQVRTGDVVTVRSTVASGCSKSGVLPSAGVPPAPRKRYMRT